MTARDIFTDAAPQVPEAAEQTCGKCGLSTPWVTSYGSDTGFVDCELLPAGHRINARSTCALTPVRWVASDPKKIAQRGIDQAVAAADREIYGWSGMAFEFVREFAEKNRGRQYIGHEIVEASKGSSVPRPPNDKAFGAVIQRAARVGVIKRVGYAEDPNRHGNPVPLWETV